MTLIFSDNLKLKQPSEGGGGGGEKLKYTVVIEEKINPVNVQIEVNEGV